MPDVLKIQEETRDHVAHLVDIQQQSLKFQRQTVLALQDLAASIKERTEARRKAVLAQDKSAHK